MADIYTYNGKITPEFKSEAISEYNRYKSDREPILSRIRDNERYFQRLYNRSAGEIEGRFSPRTPLIFSCIENAASNASESYPSANILERDPNGTKAAEALSKILPVQLEMCGFRSVYDKNALGKIKYGTAAYGVFYNDITGNIDVRSVDMFDIFVDTHLEDIQDSRFLFISAAVDNDVLKERYPDYEKLFTGDAVVETSTDSYTLTNRSVVLDCYYKKPGGAVHMMKLCKDAIIAATEDMEGYDNGLYDHGKYPIVFDVMFPIENCPYGFGYLDIGKATQIHINKVEGAITENILINSKQRYFSKRNGGINTKEFTDVSNAVVHVDGDISSNIGVIQSSPMNQYSLSFLTTLVEYLKEILGNRDFQQGGTAGGVTAASAIQILRETGEKRSRKMANDTYKAYKKIVYMSIELIRQFYDDPRIFRIRDEDGRKAFIEFSNRELKTAEWTKDGELVSRPIEFDIEVVPQVENPYTAEMQNQLILSLWKSGFFSEQNFKQAMVAMKNMSFKMKQQLMNDFQNMLDNKTAEQAQMPQQNGNGAKPIDPQAAKSNAESGLAPANGKGAVAEGDELVPIDITASGVGGGMNV